MDSPLGNFTSSSGINTEKLIQDLLKAERIPLERLELDISDAQNQITLWRDLESNMKSFQSAARGLYSFDNSFDTFAVTSENPAILTATSSRAAISGNFPIEVQQIASADRWISENLPIDYTVSKGSYTIAIGTERVSFSVDEVSLEEFVKQLNVQGKNLVKASILKKGTEDTQSVLLLESLKLGKKSGLRLSSRFEKLAKDIQLITQAQDTTEIPLTLSTAQVSEALSDPTLFADAEKTKKNQAVLRLLPGALGTVQISGVSSLLQKDGQLSLSFLLQEKQETDETYTASPPLEAKLDDVSVPSSNARSFRYELDSPDLPILIHEATQTVLYSINSSRVFLGDTISLDLELSDVQKASDLVFTVLNPFTEYDLQFVKASLSQKSAETQTVPKNPLSRAQNAILRFNGLDIEREDNTIADVIPGLTLNLKRPSEDLVNITVTQDTEQIIEDIIFFVGTYNQLMQKLLIYSKNDPLILSDISFASDSEQERATENLGALSGNYGLTRFINSLERALVQQYTSPDANQTSSLRSIGIEQSSEGNASSDSRKYLNIDQTKLERALSDDFSSIKQLFASDRDSDLTIDYGIAFITYELLDGYVQGNGVVSQRKSSLERDINEKERRRQGYLSKLERTESNLRRKYGIVEQSVYQLEQTQKSLNTFSGQ